MGVSVLVTNWNGRKLLEKNLPQVLEAVRNPENKIEEILVIDDFSSDDSPDYLRKNFPQVKVFKHKKNFGYSVTCNTGVKEAKGDLVVILNNDVAPRPDFLKQVLPHFKDPSVFAVSFDVGKFGPGKLIWKDGWLNIQPTEQVSKTCLTGWPNGGSSVFRKKYWQELRGMDELFLPFYFEDLDLGIRAYKAGWRCLLEPKAKVYHQHEATINTISFNQSYLDLIKQRNHLLLTWKHIDSFKLLFSHLFFIIRRIFLHPTYIKITIAALCRWTDLILVAKNRARSGLSTVEILKMNEKI
ncbi:MAG: N-acetylglucosaminyl-diphospho-decaprenol L-rhamnosyltransferase [Microgenomates group bacterium ADurb.Bin219]|nr:MAG: N-acetylglucosaminyl-diphospho-decaprenol L-rhamnosyltransferase [Microgenomates group bacterium ADurb.Bin219]